MRFFISFLILFTSYFSMADLKPLDDATMSDLDGAGLAFVLEDFVYDASSAEVSIKDVVGVDKINVESLYIMGEGSNKGANQTAITLGRLEDPYSFDVDKIDSETGLVLNFPSIGLNSREKADVGVKFKFSLSGKTDIVDMSATGFSLNGSRIRLWGNSSDTLGDLRLRLRSDTLDTLTCDNGAANCNSDGERNSHTVYLTGVAADLFLGSGTRQPLNFSIKSDGNFVFELKAITLADVNAGVYTPGNANYIDKSRVSINNLNFGGSRPSTAGTPQGGANLGRTAIDGLRFQYLRVESYDL